MALDSGDLQHRRTAAAKPSKGLSDRRTVNGNGTSSSSTTTVRRRRRRTRAGGQSRTAALVAGVATLLLLLAAFALLASTGGSGEDSDRKGVTAVVRRSLRDWKPKRRGGGGGGGGGSLRDRKPDEDSKARAGGGDANDAEREARYRSLYRPKFDESVLGYDIHDCPFDPPPGYPMAWKTTEVLGDWNPSDVTTLPPDRREVHQGLCVFDYGTQYETALNYRDSEKPFVIRNDPQVVAAARRWEDDPEYLRRVLDREGKEYRTERSPVKTFLWYRLKGKQKEGKGVPRGYERPENDEVEMTYGEWLERALEKDGRALDDRDALARAKKLRDRRLGDHGGGGGGGEKGDDSLADDDGDKEEEESEESKDRSYYYLRINASIESPQPESSFVYDELPFLDPRKPKHSEFYLVEPLEERGINCRFGMRGVTAANHFDMSRNTIALLGGERRYVLASPSQCDKMALYPAGHPSVRHSSLDWSDPTGWEERPEFGRALVNEVVLRAGDVLYLPTNWFHYIVNLSLNYQCNARSGIGRETARFITDCGFEFHKG